MRFTLQQLGLIDAPPEIEYDNLTSLAAETLDVPMALVSILDRDKRRIFYKSQHGSPEELIVDRQLPMELTYCQHVPQTKAPVVVADARVHPLLKETPAQKDGPLAYLGLPISSPDGQIVGGLCMMQPKVRQWSDREIESAKKLADCVSDLIRLKAAMLTSERLRQEQREFTYAISHDLKSPANTLHMILNEIAVEGESLSEDTQMLVTEGLGTLQRMRQQVEDVLLYSRTVDINCVFETVSLAQLIEDIIQDLKGDIADASATVNCADMPVIAGNRIQLRALFQNLINNALKFRSADCDPVVDITASFNEERNEHCIAIKDNGIGIATEDQAKIFSLFTRLHLHDHYAGSGIGLALCHRVAENHHGAISIASDGHNGSTFSVIMPACQP